MASFSTTTRYSEQRPAWAGEAAHTIAATLEGSGSIAGQTFSGALYAPGGTEVAGAVAVEIASAASRVVTVTVAGTDLVVGDHRWLVRRTDDDSAAVVAEGVLEVVDPAKF